MGVHVVQSGQILVVQGMTKARTTYKVVVSGGLLDEFGQTLGHDEPLTFHVTDAVPTTHASYLIASCTGGLSCLFNPVSNTLTWDLGTVEPAAGR